MNNNDLKLPNHFRLMEKDKVIYDFKDKVGILLAEPSIGKTHDWSWKDLEAWALLRVIPNGYPSTAVRLAVFDITVWSWEAQLVLTRATSSLDFYWLKFRYSETFDNLPHCRSADFPIYEDTKDLIPLSPKGR